MVLRKLKNYSVLFGMIFTVASLLACFIFTWVIYEDEIFARKKEYLFDCGVDVMGAFTYTDGVPEAKNANSEMFKTDRMMDALSAAANADPEETLRIVRNSVDAFVGNAEQFDDLTMLCLEYKGPDHPSSAEQ